MRELPKVMIKRMKKGGREGMTRVAPMLLLLGLLQGSIFTGCSEEDLGLAVNVYFPCNQYNRTAGISPFTDVSYVEVCLNYSQADLDPNCAISTLSSGEVEFPDIRLGKPLRVGVEGRATQARGTPLAYGQTAPVVADDSQLQDLDLMVSLVDRFGTATDRPSCQGLSCKCSQMRTPRIDFTATVLHDGRVLIAGGRDDSNVILDSAEILDPKDGTFRYVASRLNFARAGHSAVRLGSQYGYRVLLLGGESEDQQWRIAEYYDPKTNGFYKMDSPMFSARVNFTATRLNDGRVLLAGGMKGQSPAEEFLATMEIYNPARDAFQEVTGVLNEGREHHTATVTTVGRPDSQILIAGGKKNQVALSSANVVEIEEGSTSATVTELTMPGGGRWGHDAAKVGPGDQVLIVGGSNNDQGGGVGVLSSMELFFGHSGNPRFVTWTDLNRPELCVGRWGLTVTPIEAPSGTGLTTRALLVVGGLDAAINSVAQAEVLIPDDPEDPTGFSVDCTAERVIRDSRYGHRAVKLPSGKVIAVGGIYRYQPDGDLEVLNTGEIYEPGPTYWCGNKNCADW